jgi:hypothetical protein
MDDFAPPTIAEATAAETCLTSWLAGLPEHPMVAAVVEDVESEIDRWFVRVNGEAKDVYSVWFTLGQRTLAYETYVMPAPEENPATFYAQLLRRNDGFRDIAFSIGEEEAIFLRGQLDLRNVTSEALDRVLGSVYAAVELCFVPALRVGFASRFAD